MIVFLSKVARKFYINVFENLSDRLVEFKSRQINGVDIIHSFNIIINCNCAWVLTYETAVPRCKGTLCFHHEIFTGQFSREYYEYMHLLASDKCKKLIALSNSADYICRDMMIQAKVNDFERTKIFNKMTVIHPPQEALVSESVVKTRKNDKLKFIFVGRDFFRKGGKELLETLSFYSSQCELVIISSLNYGDYASHAAEDEMISVRDYIKSQTWITWYSTLENDKVLAICQNCDVGLLPTFADTYGYSCLEMQACGLPVVTTNVRALNEINNNRIGWVANLAVNKYGEALYSQQESRAKMKSQLKDELKRIFSEIFDLSYDDIKKKGLYSLMRIKNEHNPKAYAEKIAAIYKK